VDDILFIAQDNNPAAQDVPCYLTSEGQGDSRPNGYRNKHKRYSADRVRVSTPIFLQNKNQHHQNHSDWVRVSTPSFSRDKSFAQNKSSTSK